MTRKQRALVLAKYLESGAVDTGQFDMSTWETCAINEATSYVPSLIAEGLTKRVDGCSGEPEYEGRYGFEALGRFFGLTYDVAERVFGCAGRTPIEVAKDLRRAIKGK